MITCDTCKANLQRIGLLGRWLWYRCVKCGSELAICIEDLDLDEWIREEREMGIMGAD